MRVVLHPEARDEVRFAALWYDEQRPGLGTEFVAQVVAVLERIASHPHSFPSWPGVKSTCDIRRAVLRRFPYVIGLETHAANSSSWQSRMQSAARSTGFPERA